MRNRPKTKRHFPGDKNVLVVKEVDVAPGQRTVLLETDGWVCETMEGSHVPSLPTSLAPFLPFTEQIDRQSRAERGRSAR